MFLSQKTQYAVRGVFELARRWDNGPIKINDIAEAQAVPSRFLEIILGQLKQSGLVDSKRGSEGGYFLTRSPATISVGEVIRFMQGPLTPVECTTGKASNGRCALYDQCVFLSLWQDAEEAINDVFDGTTFSVLLERERQMGKEDALSYCI